MALYHPSTMLVPILGTVASVLLLFALGARRFERRQRRLGRWDEYGPLEESSVPKGGRYGGLMNWHMEALGRLKAPIERRRRRHEKPHE